MSSFGTLPTSSRSAVLSLLSRLFLREVDEALLRQLTREDIAATLEALAPGAAAEVTRALRDEGAREELDVEYCRLFLLPKGVSPFAAAWGWSDTQEQRAVLQDRIGGLFDRLRLRPQDSGLGHLPADHVGILLALASVALTGDEQGALADEALAILRAGRDRFAAAVAERTTSPLYRASALLLEEVLGA